MPEPPTNPPLSASQQWELAQKARAEPSAPPGPDIKTKGERDHLTAQREVPKLERHLTPGGTVEKEVHSTEAQQREARIREINASLQKASTSLNKDFDLARDER